MTYNTCSIYGRSALAYPRGLPFNDKFTEQLFQFVFVFEKQTIYKKILPWSFLINKSCGPLDSCKKCLKVMSLKATS